MLLESTKVLIWPLLVTNIAQRHGNPEFQPATTDQLYPVHKHLLIRRSVRCKVSRMVIVVSCICISALLTD